jgi:hypothetical protein
MKSLRSHRQNKIHDTTMMAFVGCQLQEERGRVKRLSPRRRGEGLRSGVLALTERLVQWQSLTLPLSLFKGRGAYANCNNSR